MKYRRLSRYSIKIYLEVPPESYSYHLLGDKAHQYRIQYYAYTGNDKLDTMFN